MPKSNVWLNTIQILNLVKISSICLDNTLTRADGTLQSLFSRFYRHFHSARLGDNRIELLLNCALQPDQLAGLNLQFDDLVEEGVIQASETVDDAGLLRPCLNFHFNRRRIGRLYQLLDSLNWLEVPPEQLLTEPGRRQPSPPSAP